VEIIDAVIAAELVGTKLSDSFDSIGSPFPTNPIMTYQAKGIDFLNKII